MDYKIETEEDYCKRTRAVWSSPHYITCPVCGRILFDVKDFTGNICELKIKCRSCKRLIHATIFGDKKDILK